MDRRTEKGNGMIRTAVMKNSREDIPSGAIVSVGRRTERGYFVCVIKDPSGYKPRKGACSWAFVDADDFVESEG